MAMLELDDSYTPGTVYSLGAESMHTLQAGGTRMSFRLVGVMRRSTREPRHYISDVRDPRVRTWVRFDAAQREGVGWQCEPCDGMLMHVDGRQYYPVAAMYVHVDEDSATPAAGAVSP